MWKSSVDFPSDITRICWSWFPSTNKGFLVTYPQILTLKVALEHQSNWSQENLRQITFDDWSKRIFPLVRKNGLSYFCTFVHDVQSMQSSRWNKILYYLEIFTCQLLFFALLYLNSCPTHHIIYSPVFEFHMLCEILDILYVVRQYQW